MIIERLEAASFGPFQGEVFEFGPGMTVVFGPNEAGKSSLHAALYAGLCGIRRARGQPRIEDREFQNRHHPWDGGDWQVTLHLELVDGRRIELRQDLAGRVACRATDDLGRDVTAEIVHDGSPDGSRWLGLTRRSFLATACVRQAELVRVADEPAALQEELQRAAASAGRDATAAAAIDRLRAFRSEQVGLDRANSTKPLRKTKKALGERRRLMDVARAEHSRVLQLLVEVEARESEVEATASRVRLIEGALAVRAARVRETELERIQELATLAPEEPIPIADDADLSREVSEALARFDSAPPMADLTGPTASSLEEELASLPDVPSGDLEVHPDIQGAFSQLDALSRALRMHAESPPAPVSLDRSPDITDEELHRLRDALETSPPDIDRELGQHVTKAREAYEGQQPPRWSKPAIGVGATLAIAGAVAILLAPVPAVALLVAGVVLFLWGLATMRGGRGQLSALQKLRSAELALGDAQHRADAARRNRESAITRLEQLGVEPTPEVVSAWIEDRRQEAASRHATDEWLRQENDLQRELDRETTGVRNAFASRGVAVGESVADSFRVYQEACRARSLTAREAARRTELEAQVAARRARDDAALRRVVALQGLSDVAHRISVLEDDPAVQAARLREWQELRSEALAAHEADVAVWTELQTLLGGRTIGEVEADAADRRRHADEVAMSCDPQQLEEFLGTDLDAELRAATAMHTEAVSAAGHAQGEARTAAEGAPSVPDAEEALARTAAELDRVVALDGTLEATLEYLERAQDRVHRDIAPILRNSIVTWLPRVTERRYEDVKVDPQSLAVRVLRSGGDWRDVARLSHGTREQIYLLLRLALAEHLVEAPEQAPLLFDEVTAHYDTSRREAILELLHEFASNRQVIVFTHEDDVREWASRSLETPRDRIVVHDTAVG